MTGFSNELVVDITLPEGLRALDEKHVAALAESMAAIGLQTPISIHSDAEGRAILIAGQHRLAAAKKLGWDSIDVVVMKGDDFDRELWHIDENLCRAELTEQERAEHLKRRQELFEARQVAEIQVGKIEPPEKAVGYKSPPKQTKGFAANTAAKTGMSKAAINKSIARAEKIPADVKQAIANTPAADKGVELDALASMQPDDQREAVKMVEAGSASDFRDAKQFIDGVEADQDKREKAVKRAYIAFAKLDHYGKDAYLGKLWDADWVPEWMKVNKKWRA